MTNSRPGEHNAIVPLDRAARNVPRARTPNRAASWLASSVLTSVSWFGSCLGWPPALNNARRFKLFEPSCIRHRGTRAARRELRELAAAQGGYFAARQAVTGGHVSRRLDYHVKRGDLQGAGYGLDGLPTIAPTEHDDLVRLFLWSRNRADSPDSSTLTCPHNVTRAA